MVLAELAWLTYLILTISIGFSNEDSFTKILGIVEGERVKFTWGDVFMYVVSPVCLLLALEFLLIVVVGKAAKKVKKPSWWEKTL